MDPQAQAVFPGQPHGEGEAYAGGYKISREGIAAVEDYVAKERAVDFKKWESPALFLSPATNAHGDVVVA